MQAYRVLKQSDIEPKATPGTIIYPLAMCDYGLGSDDSRMFGVACQSFTLNPEGDYPGFVMKMQDVEKVANPQIPRDELIAECMQDALNDGDGRPRPDALAHHLAKRGLVIVEAQRLERMQVAIQLIGSAAVALVASPK
jgi:hypothetical protein